jgi:hypothetical protein
MKHSSAPLVASFLLAASTANISASVLWDFSTTGEGQTISGTLTTDGTPADLGAPKNFAIQSIESLLLNGSPVAGLLTPLPWVEGVSAGVSVGPLIWDGNAVQLPIFVLAQSNGGDLLEIDNNNDPNFPNFKARIEGVVAFDTDSTTIVPVQTAVPDAGSSFGLLAIGIAAVESIRKLRGESGRKP